MPKTIRGTCPDMVCDLIREHMERQKKEKEEENKKREGVKGKKPLKVEASKLKAAKEVGKTLDLPVSTVRTMYRRKMEEKVDSGEATKKDIQLIKKIETIVTAEDNDVECELKLIDGVRFLAVHEYRQGREGGKIATGNHFNFTMELLDKFKDFFAGLNVVDLRVMEPSPPAPAEKPKYKPIEKKEAPATK